VVNKCDIFSLKCTRILLAAGFRPDPLGELKRSRPPVAIRGKGLPGRERRGGEGMERGSELTGRGGEKEGERKWEGSDAGRLGG